MTNFSFSIAPSDAAMWSFYTLGAPNASSLWVESLPSDDQVRAHVSRPAPSKLRWSAVELPAVLFRPARPIAFLGVDEATVAGFLDGQLKAEVSDDQPPRIVESTLFEDYAITGASGLALLCPEEVRKLFVRAVPIPPLRCLDEEGVGLVHKLLECLAAWRLACDRDMPAILLISGRDNSQRALERLFAYLEASSMPIRPELGEVIWPPSELEISVEGRDQHVCMTVSASSELQLTVRRPDQDATQEIATSHTLSLDHVRWANWYKPDSGPETLTLHAWQGSWRERPAVTVFELAPMSASDAIRVIEACQLFSPFERLTP